MIVFAAPDEVRLRKLLKDADQKLFRSENAVPLPLEGRKVHWQIGE